METASGSKSQQEITFPYGAVYFRKTNPPASDWESDYDTAAQDGMSHFRHWFMWAAVEYARDEFDWDDYDRHMDLAARHGIGTIIAEFVAIPPEWMYLTYPDGRYERPNGERISSKMHVSATIGGSPGMCLDNDDVRERAGNFLTQLVMRYRDHPATAGYNVWNECNSQEDVCHCPATTQRFRQWLIAKYETVDRLRSAWGRYYGSWSEVGTPRENGPYGQNLDWLAFRTERAHELLSWRVDLIRSLDDRHPITAHGVAGSLGFGVPRTTDDWRAADAVDSYGFTYAHSRRGDRRWKQPLAAEIVRSAARGKTFWHTEAQGGPLWLQPQVVGRELDDGRVTAPEDIRFWQLVSFAGGARGLFYPRWRPLLDGPLFGAFGPYGMDGERTERSHQSSRMARWARDPSNRDLWQATPVPDPVTLLYLPDSQAFAYLLRNSVKPYEHAISGAWRALFDIGFHASFSKLEDLHTTSVAYLPYPMLLPSDAIATVRDWVATGGTLISEGAPGWFDEQGRAHPRQPAESLAELFGTEQQDILFTPDILDNLTFSGSGFTAHGGEIRQTWRPTTGTPTAWYDDGEVAMVDHTFGKGRTRLIGTMPGIGYSTHSGQGTRDLFDHTMAWAGLQPQVRLSDRRMFCRLHANQQTAFLWLLNPSREDLATEVDLSGDARFVEHPATRWGSRESIERRTATTARVTVPARDAVIIELDRMRTIGE